MMLAIKMFYCLKPLIPRELQIFLRRKRAKIIKSFCSSSWPIDNEAATSHCDCIKWPQNKKFALVLTHDVETLKGQKKCFELMELEKKLGFRSAFYFVPERYSQDKNLRTSLINQGFEIGIHGLKHDGKLFQNKKIFSSRAIKINEYLKEWRAVGFRSPAMHHNLDWIHDLNIEYDSSTFDTDPFEPYPDGVKTIFPFFVNSNPAKKGYVELPYTLPHDFTLFIILKQHNIDIWIEKLDWLAEHGGMALVVTHPDYMNFTNRNSSPEEYPAKFYNLFLQYIKKKYEGEYWHALPNQVAKYIFETAHPYKVTA